MTFNSFGVCKRHNDLGMSKIAMGKVYKFYSMALAQSFRDRLTKTALIILGDDGRFWVACGRDAAELMKQGYEVA